MNLQWGDELIERLGDRVVSPHRAEDRSGTCIVSGDVHLVDDLLRAGIEVDHRPSGLRVSPHVHTSGDDIERAAAVIEATRSIERTRTAQ